MKLYGKLLAVLFSGGLIAVGLAVYSATATIRELLLENKRLQAALATLTTEERIGYAKVIDQKTVDGTLYTTLRFVETARGDPLTRVLEREYVVEGDVVHFDALIVKFDSRLVLDGRERSLYLWRRVYGEGTPPAEGMPIETFGATPPRYAGLLDDLPREEAELFWDAVWDLANDPGRLRDLGVDAVYGTAVYTQLRPGLVYVFRISPTGQLRPEVIPDM